MARKGRRRSGVRPANVSATLALGTLANITSIKQDFPDTVDKPTFSVSADLVWGLTNPTSAEGNIIVGLAHGDYTQAEIDEYIENQGAWGTSSLQEQEVARRKIRVVGTFPSNNGQDIVLNDGKPIRTRLRFSLDAGQTLSFWAYNRSGAALTTGSSVIVNGTVWLSK